MTNLSLNCHKKLQRRCYTIEGLELLYMIKVPLFSCIDFSSSCHSILMNFAVPLNLGVQGPSFLIQYREGNAVKSPHKITDTFYQYSTGFCSAEIGLNP